MIYNYFTTLNTSFPEVSWKLIDPNNETPDFLLPENKFASFKLDKVIYPDCFEAVKGTLPSKSDLETEMNRLQVEFDGQEYARNRASAYDSIGNQLDQLMKDMRDGTTTHQTACEAVKAKYPKPE